MLAVYTSETEDGREQRLGVYLRTDEDAIEYRDEDGALHWAPADCVTVREDPRTANVRAELLAGALADVRAAKAQLHAPLWAIVAVPKPSAPFGAWMIPFHAEGPFADRERARERAHELSRSGSNWTVRLVQLMDPPKADR